MSVRPQSSPLERAERWLWTGPAGHLAGGALDLLQALARHLLSRVRERAAR
ncbi:MAG TPA: hypothetical protein VI296_00525 [Candidatus Dormibacteraeota bacterium]